MKKIALVSYFKEPNYGTMLQAYALSKVISDKGFENEYISYFARKKTCFLLRIVKSFIKRFIRLRQSGEFDFFKTKDFEDIINKFHLFKETYIPYSKEDYFYNTIAKANKIYDSFIVGSDQTWSQYMNQGCKTINFLFFVKEPSRKMCYAPSFGTTYLSSQYMSFLVEALSSFKYLSCREKENCEELQKQLKKTVYNVLDPTLLRLSTEWDELEEKTPNMPENYILAYILGTKQLISDFAEKLGNEKGLPVYYILTRPDYLTRKNLLSNVGPKEFLGLIKRARFVVTDSFHGTIFSINYNVPFYSFAKRTKTELDISNNDNERILLFLKVLHLESRFIHDDDTQIKFDSTIDFNEVNKILEIKRKESFKYLSMLLD